MTTDRPTPAQATILVVDDEPDLLEVLELQLGALGYEVLTASDGDAARKVIDTRAESIDLLLTDVLLPGQTNGADVAETLRARKPTARVLYMSGHPPGPALRERDPDASAALLLKPFTRTELETRIGVALTRPVAVEGLSSGLNR